MNCRRPECGEDLAPYFADDRITTSQKRGEDVFCTDRCRALWTLDAADGTPAERVSALRELLADHPGDAEMPELVELAMRYGSERGMPVASEAGCLVLDSASGDELRVPWSLIRDAEVIDG